ncbi:DoxX family protein [Psychromonas ossibalaenae]|uniref:DoxX family protein n=1 Tax=Psychromonas ossibalaenae TaxID=444922 RepID=UPI000365C536|nr:DoxX family protein [Psychromonas ossibalaenae]
MINFKNIKYLLNTTTSIAPLILRIPLGIILIAHGAQKLFGWFGGYGLKGTGQWMASVGFEPGMLMALLAGSGEFFGGIALIFGLLTRPAAAVAAFTMLVAMTVHWENGLFLADNGYEFALILLFASVSLLIQGAGRYSLDNQLNNHLLKESVAS